MNKSAKGQVPAVATSPKLDPKADAIRSRNSTKKDKGVTDKQEGTTVGNITSDDTNRDDDAFNKHYNKELKVSKEEIPIVLTELNDSAYQFIKKEQYERALNLLQKAYGIMDVVDFTVCRRDKYHLFIMFHNMALCYQKMQMLEECASCIDQALEQLPSESINLQEKSISNRMRKLAIIGRLRMQFCAILSQIHRHKDALSQAKESVKLNHLVINDLRELCLFYINREEFKQVVPPALKQEKAGRNDQINKSYQSADSNKSMQDKSLRSNRNRSFSSFLSQQEAYGASDSMQAPHNKPGLQRQNSQNSLSSFASVNQMESSMSYIEKTARKLYPILKELKKRMIPEKKRTLQRGKNISVNDADESDDLIVDLANERMPVMKNQATDMKNILGYLNQGEWTSKLSIGSIMQLEPYKIRDLIEEGQNELELTRESFIQKVSSLTVSYFCYSTEIRFIIQMKEDSAFDSPVKQKESEYWHAKALEITCTFLPGECPLLSHIHVSYQKHFAPVKSVIQENEKQDDKLMVIKPLNGVDNLKVQPIIRKLNDIQFAITPYPMTPLHKMTNQVLGQLISFNEYSEQQSQGINGPIITSNQILGKLSCDDDLEEDDMAKLERIFNKLLSKGQVNKNDLIQKLIKASDLKSQELSVRSVQVSELCFYLQENIQENLDDNASQLSRIAVEEQRQKHKAINTSSNFYKFKQQQELKASDTADRPRSSNGRLRGNAEGKTKGNLKSSLGTSSQNSVPTNEKAGKNSAQSKIKKESNFQNSLAKILKTDQIQRAQPQPSLNPQVFDKLNLSGSSPDKRQAAQPISSRKIASEAQIQNYQTMLNTAGLKENNPQAYEELKKRILAEYKKLANKNNDDSEAIKSGGNLNVYKPTFIINNNIQNDSKRVSNAGIVKQKHDQTLQQQVMVKKTHQIIQQQQQVYDKKPSTPDVGFDQKKAHKSTRSVVEMAANKPQKGQKLANQSQAQYLTQNAQILTASGGHAISNTSGIIAPQDHLLAYKTAKPGSATGQRRSNSSSDLVQKFQSDAFRPQAALKSKHSVKQIRP